MKIWGPICVLACMVALGVYYWRELFDRDEEVYHRRWLIRWLVRGIALPLVIWIFLNMGRTPVMPAVNPPKPPLGAVTVPTIYGSVILNAGATAPTVPAVPG